MQNAMLETSGQISLLITNVDYKRKDPVFWIEVNTDLPQYKLQRKRIPRYYSELKRLYHLLESTLDDVLIPALPSCPLPRFSADGQLVGKQWWFTIRLPFEEQQHQHQHQQQQQHIEDSYENNYEKLQIWLNRISAHERVKQSDLLREFVESEVGFRPSSKRHILSMYKKSPSAPSSSTSTTTAAAAISPHYVSSSFLLVSKEDMEPEYVHNDQLLQQSYQSMQQILTKMNRLLQQRQDLAAHWMHLSASYVSYGGLERNPDLFVLYKKLAKGLQQYHDLETSQATATNETVGEEIEYEIRNCEVTQNAMHRRLVALSDYIASRKQTESSLRNVERLKSSTHIDRNKASEAIAILEESRVIENYNLQKFQRVDTHLRSDIEECYKPNVTRDLLRHGLTQYAKSQLFLERKKLLLLEEVYSLLPPSSSTPPSQRNKNEG